MGDRALPWPTDATLILDVDVVGRPATFATSHEQRWKDAVRTACIAAQDGVQPGTAASRFAVEISFRTSVPTGVGEVWDLDNLVKPTLDAMESVFGKRQWRGRPQPADDRVDYLLASKRTVTAGEPAGASVRVWVVN